MYCETKSDKSIHTPTNMIILSSLNAQKVVTDEEWQTLFGDHLQRAGSYVLVTLQCLEQYRARHSLFVSPVCQGGWFYNHTGKTPAFWLAGRLLAWVSKKGQNKEGNEGVLSQP